MHIIIKPMETEAEIRGKAFVHWTAWNEAYTGLIDQSYLDRRTLAKCVETAHLRPENTLVALDGDQVAGFVNYGKCRDTDLTEAGEIVAIYTLRKYYGQGIGSALMEAALKQLEDFPKIAVWVLKNNGRAIRFYEKHGFRPDGQEKPLPDLGAAVVEIRLLLNRHA